MSLFKKRLSEDEISLLQLDILRQQPKTEEVQLLNTIKRMQTLFDNVNKLKEATGQDVIVLEDYMFKPNEDGTLTFKELSRNFTYDEEL